MRLSIRPFGDVPSGTLEDLAEDLASLGTVTVLEPAPLRPEWFNPDRGQHRSEALLDAVEADPGDRVLGVTAADLYATAAPFNFVFGEARVYDRPAAISLARLRSPEPARFRDRVAKEAIHELGHTLGLDHCENRGCVMVFSNSADDVDRKTRTFCRRCRATVDFTAKRLRA
ncbi:MAG: hypothetical protein A3K65_00745 [Euryarchaeota archaeon RBG_16_68_12]|nr:MAG: hypothetical protein A3K65_00745 [Euryarchaeota archaeon RBG_16_68_12]